MRMNSRLAMMIVPGLALGLMIAGPARAADSDPAKETSTAATHAGLAAKATDMKTTQMHLHHVVNCLVGPSGTGFDAAPGNPCKEQGNGAIPDTKDAAQKKTLQDALDKANAGLKQTDLAAAQKAATDAQGLLSQKAM
jgi:hypothetical protein